MPNDKFYSTPVWRNIRRLVLVRDHNLCVLCGSAGPYLQVDHIKARKKFPELALEMSNLRTLCARCHSQAASSWGRTSNYKETPRPQIGYDGFPIGWDKE